MQWSLLILLALGLAGCTGGTQNSSTPATAANSPVASPAAADAPPQVVPAKKVFETGEAVPAGYLGYKVVGSWFQDQPAGKDDKQAATYLYIDMAIVNTDKKERPVGALKVIDETGKEYALSDKAPAKGLGVAQAGIVGSAQSKRVTAAFEAPKGHQYKLKLQGFSATDEVQINLKPGATAPAK